MIVNCDDFGISKSVSTGILNLVKLGRVSSVSCMVVFEPQNDLINELKGYHQQIDIGLHLVFTDYKPLTSDNFFPSLNSLIKEQFATQKNSLSYMSEIDAQIIEFKNRFGFYPDFIDGHKHIQQFPLIADTLIQVTKKYGAIKYIRSSYLNFFTTFRFLLKFKFEIFFAHLIFNLIGKFFKFKINKAGIKTNSQLLGYYSHLSQHKFSQIFQDYLDHRINKNDVFFCHPGFVDEELKSRDIALESRLDNYNFLSSHEYSEFLKKNQISINKFDPNL